ncbi:MAG: LPS export ABC transporter permease LptF [Thermodesulfobacteriota bacterium]
MSRLLSAYIFKEILVPFVLATVILTATVLLSKTLELIDLVVGHGVGPGLILKFIISLLPTFLTNIIPIAFLISIIISYSRFSSSHEIIAMKAAGIGLTTHLKPVMSFAAVLFIILIALTTYINPWGFNNIKKIMYDVARTKTTAGIEEQTFNNRFKGVVLYVDHMAEDGFSMEGVFISQRDSGKGETLIFAKRGHFAPSSEDLSVSLVLEEGTMQIPEKASLVESNEPPFHLLKFQKYSLSLEHKQKLNAPIHKRPNRELYLPGIIKKIEMERANGGAASSTRVSLHKRFALPASVFIFALLGIPLGIQRVRSAGFTNFSVALAVIIFYFALSQTFESIGKDAGINPVLAVWASNIILAASGVYLFYRTAKDQPLKSLEWLDSALTLIGNSIIRALSHKTSKKKPETRNS